ncbi:MAG: hypothetical protein EOM65_06620 [Synergistales bacterium]|nr:hypothetical protein [Synergistales bacterium]
MNDSWTNPLRDQEDRRLPRIAGPSVLVLFGVTGDLARKKLLPAIYDLANHGALPPGFGLVGFARRDWTNEQFLRHIEDSVREYARTPFLPEVWRQLSGGVDFVSGSFNEPAAFDRLKNTLDRFDRDHGTGGNHAFYLSIPPKNFEQVIEQLDAHGLTDQSGGWKRAIIEKPFGNDLASSQDLNRVVSAAFPPESVFRIDHFLGKEGVQAIYTLRFANKLFGTQWDRHSVAQVQIDVPETLNVANRASFYEATGAALDMLVTHLFQVVSQVAMDTPYDLSDPDSVLFEREAVLHRFRPLDVENAVLELHEYMDVAEHHRASAEDTRLQISS